MPAVSGGWRGKVGALPAGCLGACLPVRQRLLGRPAAQLFPESRDGRPPPAYISVPGLWNEGRKDPGQEGVCWSLNTSGTLLGVIQNP